MFHNTLHRLQRRLTLFCLAGLLILTLGASQLRPAHAAPTGNAVVNAPCGEAEFDEALAFVEDTGGGVITFNCGVATIHFTAHKVITTDVTVDGGGGITLNGGGVTRLFYVGQTGHLTLRNLILTDGVAVDSINGNYGGAVFVTSGGRLDVERSTIRNSHADLAGGAIIDFQGIVTLTDSVIEANSSNYAAINSTGTLTLIRTLVRNNTAIVGGGGLSVGGAVSIHESTIENNSAPQGGALYVTPSGNVTIVRTTFTGNRAEAADPDQAMGGAIISYGRLTIEDSTFNGNSAQGHGGALAAGAGSGEATTTIRGSTFIDNQAAISGGAIENRSGPLTIVNSTLSSNGANTGGAIQNYVGPVEISYTTLVANTGGTLNQRITDELDERQQFRLSRSVLAGGNHCTASGISVLFPQFVSDNHNLADDDSCAAYLTQPDDRNNTAPLLGALSANGGPTLTHPPQVGSPLIDAAACLTDPSTDQRGVARPQGAGCDIGAVEVVDNDATPMPPFEHATIGGVKPTIAVNPTQGYAGQGFTVQGNAAGAAAVRIAWSQDGQVLTIAERSIGGAGNYQIDLSVPTVARSGNAEICATITGQEVAEYACVPFTVVDAPVAAISGALPGGVVGAANVEVHLLDASGVSLYSTAVDSAGRFNFANVPSGFYHYAVMGNPTTNIAGGIANIAPGANSLLPDRFLLGDALKDPCLFPAANTGMFSATPSHRTFKQLITSTYVNGIRASLRQLPQGAARQLNATAPSNDDDLYFGIYMTGAPLSVQFTAAPQVRAGESVASVRFTILRADNDAAIVIGNDGAAPYQATFDVGALPAGQHRIKAEALNSAGATLSTMCKSLVVVSSILPDTLTTATVSAAGLDALQKTVQFVPNPTNPEKGYYRVRGFVPPAAERAWPPAPIPNPPPQWPLIGTVDNRVGLRMEFDIEMALDGELRFRFVRSDIYAKMLGSELCNNSRDLLSRNYKTRFNYLKPEELYIPLNSGSLCSFNTGRSLFRGEINSLWGLLAFGVGIRTHYDGSMSFTGSLQPLAMNIQGTAIGSFYPSLIVDGWIRLFWGVAGGGITPRADIVSIAAATINTKGSPPYSTVACAAINVWVNVWARVNYLFGSKTWNLWNKSLLTESTCLPAAEVLASRVHDDPPPPRVMAAPAIASSDDGQMITVYVEDTAPTAPVARAQIIARFRNSDAEPWGDPIALTDGAHMVQDPTVVFYNGDRAIAAWTETVMTPEEDAAATELSQVLSRQEIFYALWNGAQWSEPVRFTNDVAADGSATLASLGRRVTLAWVRDLDGNLATRTDWRIATAQLDGEIDQWVTAYLLDAAHDPESSAAGGMNAEVKLAYDAAAAEPTVYAAWTFDRDGELNTGLDRQVVVAHWNVIDEVALNPQPLPPRDWAALNPQPLPPKDWALLNPQPLPPRTQSPTISIAEGNVLLAFLVNKPDAAGDETPIALGGEVWVARLARDGATWQAAPLRDERGRLITGEAPVFAHRNAEQLLLFRRFGDAQSTGALGQLSLSRIYDAGAPSTPIYLTNAPQQQWQGSVAINQRSGIAQIMKVARIGLRDVQAAAALAPATTNSTMQVQSEVLASSSDPVETLQIATGADPALDPLQLSQRAAPPGSPVIVTVVVRNVGRGLATGLTINLYTGQTGAGVLQGSVTAPLPLNLNESYAAHFTVVAPVGAGDIYAEVITSGDNVSTANDRAVAQLGKPSAPLLAALSEDAIFDGNLRLDWLPVEGEAVVGYRIYRSDSANGQYEFIGESGQLSYVDLLSQREVEYCYRVRAYASGSILSDASAPLCATLSAAPPAGRALYLPLVGR